MKKNKTIILSLILIICSLICSQLSSILANTKYITNDKLKYRKLEDETILISGFEIGTKVSEVLKENFASDYEVKIFDNNNNDITNEKDKIIGTGYKIRLYTVTTETNNTINNEVSENTINDIATNKASTTTSNLAKTYTVVIYGDTNGDGNINAIDALIVVKNKLSTVLFKDKVVKEAGRVTENTRKSEETPSSVDALAIVKYKLEPDKHPINQEMINADTDNNNDDSNNDNNNNNNPDYKTPVELHGKLSLNGTNIVDKNEQKFQLRGVSTHGIAWFPQYIDKSTFEYMRDEWGINVIRLAMYSNPNDGYTREMWNTVKDGVNYATDAGLYVIIDWHVLNDNNPNTYKSEAIAFFKEMATIYKDNENILYEICNEPNGNVTWENDIKPYAEEVISEIRKIDNDAIIICGTPTWSQDVDVVSQNPITDYENIMYTLHFYAATHKEDLRNKLTTAINNGLPIFVSEFGICDASGNGTIDVTEANNWMSVLNKNNISWICWNLSNKNESSSILSSSTNKITGWTEEELSQTGKWLVRTLKSARIYYRLSNNNLTINIKDGNGIEEVGLTEDIYGFNGQISHTKTYKYDNIGNKDSVLKNKKGDVIEMEFNLHINESCKLTTKITEKGGNIVTFEKEYNISLD